MKKFLISCLLSFLFGGMVFFMASVNGQESIADPEIALDNPELDAGIDAWMKGNVEKCFQLFESAWKKNPDLSPPDVLIALLYSNTKHYESVRKHLEKAVGEHPFDPEAWFQLAGIAIQEKRFVEADLLIERGEKILERPDQDPDRKSSDSRKKYLRHELLTLKANLAECREQLEKAEQYIRKITVEEPENDEAYLSLGYLYFKQKKYDEARKAFDQAAQYNEKRLPGILVLALLQEQAGNTKEAKETVGLMKPADLEDPRIQGPLVRLWMKWEKMDDAKKKIQQLQKMFPNAAMPWILEGEYDLYHHQYRPAEDAFRKAITMDSESIEANNGLALALCDQGNSAKLKQARQIAGENWERSSRTQETATTYAWILFLSGEKKEADSLFDPMLESGKINAPIAYYLAEIAYSKGDKNLALNFLDLALNQESNYPKKEAARELMKIVEENLEKERKEANEIR